MPRVSNEEKGAVGREAAQTADLRCYSHQVSPEAK